MQKTIYCKQIEYGRHDFFLKDDAGEHYLFSQRYRTGVDNYYRAGVSVDAALDFTRANEDHMVLHTMEKLPVYLRYIQKECDVKVFRKRGTRRGKSSRRRWAEDWQEAV